MNILHAFEDSRQLNDYLSRVKTLGKLKKTTREVNLGSLTLYYRVVKKYDDLYRIAGISWQQVEWHYRPEPDIEQWVYARLRCTKE